MGTKKWTPFQNEWGSFQDQKTGPKKVPRIPDFVNSFAGRICQVLFFSWPAGVQNHVLACAVLRRATRALAQQKLSPPTREGLDSEIRFAAV